MKVSYIITSVLYSWRNCCSLAALVSQLVYTDTKETDTLALQDQESFYGFVFPKPVVTVFASDLQQALLLFPPTL